MSRFGWAFVNDVIIGTGSAGTGSAVDGPTHAVVVRNDGIVSGATNFIFNNATGFGQLTGSLGITNNLSVTGSLNTGPASVVSLNATTHVSASSVTGTLRSNTGNKFGSSAGDVHQFTGSISAGIVSGTTAQFTTVTGSTLTSSVLYTNTATIPTITSTNITNSNNLKTFVLNVTGASNSVISGKDLSSLGSAASSNQIQLSPLSIENVNTFYIKPDGSKIYLHNTTDNEIVICNLATPWDISTVSLDSRILSKPVASSVAYGFTFKPDGTKAYILATAGTTVQRLYETSLSNPWQLDASSVWSSKVLLTGSSGTLTEQQGISISEDGRYLFTCSGSGINNTLIRYTMSQPWDASSITATSYDTASITLTAVVSDIAVSNDGKSILILDSNDNLYDFELETPYSLTTVTQKSSILLTSLLPSRNVADCMFLKPDQTKMFFHTTNGTEKYFSSLTMNSSQVDLVGGIHITGDAKITQNINVYGDATFEDLSGSNAQFRVLSGSLVNLTTVTGSSISSSIGQFAQLTASSADINGGTIDAASIGASSQSTGKFTSLSASSTLDVVGKSTVTQLTASIGISGSQGQFADLTASSANINGGAINSTAIGLSYNAAGRFTNLTASTHLSASQIFLGTGGMTASSNIIPLTNGIYDLGSTDNRWRDIYVSSSINVPNISAVNVTASNVVRTTGSNAYIAIGTGSNNTLIEVAHTGNVYRGMRFMSGTNEIWFAGANTDNNYTIRYRNLGAGDILTFSSSSLSASLIWPLSGTAITASSVQINGFSTPTNSSTANAIVARDASGNFSANTITATLAGNASTATNATNATNASKIAVASESTNASRYITFTNVTTGTGLDLKTNANLSYNPSTNILSTVNINNTTKIESATLTGSTGISGSQGQFAQLTASSADINAGTIDGTEIGTSNQSSGKFTTLSASSNLDIGGNLTVAGTVNLGDATSDTLNVNGDLVVDDESTFTGTATFNGSVNLGNSSQDTMTFLGVPLISNAFRFVPNIYTSSTTLNTLTTQTDVCLILLNASTGTPTLTFGSNPSLSNMYIVINVGSVAWTLATNGSGFVNNGGTTVSTWSSTLTDRSVMLVNYNNLLYVVGFA